MLGPADLPLALDHVHRHADRARLVGDAALDRLPDPPGRVGGELEAPAPVELLGRPDQAQDALLDQVQQRELRVTLVPLGDRDDEPQVRVDHALAGIVVPDLDPLGQRTSSSAVSSLWRLISFMKSWSASVVAAASSELT